MGVSTAPQISGGANPSANLRPGAASNITPVRVAFACIDHNAIASPMIASPSQISSHFSTDVCWFAITAAPIAVTPTATSPQPGTAVNEPDTSIVRRMNWRFSIIESGGSTTTEALLDRQRLTDGMESRLEQGHDNRQVLYNAKQ